MTDELPPIKKEKVTSWHAILRVGKFSVQVFTNDHGLCVQLKSTDQMVGETPLREIVRAWRDTTA